MKKIIMLFPLFLLLSNCKNEGKEKAASRKPVIKTNNIEVEYKHGVIISSESCKKNAGVSYALYLPKSYNKQKKHPVIFFFDAHARGAKPLKLYSALADKYEFIFVGSNNSKNGLDNQTLAEIISATMNDVIEKFSIDVNQIYTSGFSGGAKVASIAGFGSPQVKGVIACAAAMPEELVSRPLHFNYIGIAGLEDFNYKEMAVQESKLKNIKHHFIVFEGKHEWPPVNIMDKAVRKVISNSMEEGRREKDEDFILETNKLLKDSLIKVTYSASLQQQEEKLQQEYIQALNKKGNDWWAKEIEKVNKQTGNNTYIYKRALAYTSMICYSYVNRSIAQNNPAAANHYVQLYEMVDPQNADVFYFKAILLAAQQKNQEALQALKKSAELGFDDVGKLQNEPVFKNINASADFEEVIAKVSSNATN